MELKASKSNPPLSALIIIFASKDKPNIVWGDVNCLKVNGVKFESHSSIVRYLARSAKGHRWFGTSLFEEAEINHWLTYSQSTLVDGKLSKTLEDLDRNVAPVTYLVGNKISLGDIVVWAKLQTCSQWSALKCAGTVPMNVARWEKTIASLDFVVDALKNLPPDVQIVVRPVADGERKEEGKFVDLPGAEMGKVVVRFPPEASGYLHIGHAKAALLNQHYQQSFKGKLIMRFDDTNPAKEKEDFEKVILEDLKLLQVSYDRFTHTSDYFDLMLELCEKLIKDGKAYVDDTDPEVMKAEREQKQESINRNKSVEKNLELWTQMKSGSVLGQKCCVRAKIDMSSPNGCLRDPTIYRCKNEVHPKTGSKYKAYPTYDFACPIVDSIEGVTHCLRTMEYHDRDDQFYWFIDALGLRKPHIWEYSRLNMTNTVLSKRKLTWFVDKGYVDGWDDPRMPTVRGVLRRGMTVEGLRTFIIAQGSSKSVVFMEWDKIWAINKKIIDPVAPRYTAVETEGNVLVEVEGVKEEVMRVPKHPKNDEIGSKQVWLGPQILVDKADAEQFKEGENVTFINWGNIKIKEIIKQGGKISMVKAVPNLEDKNFKKTIKITWLARSTNAPAIPCVCVYFDHLISKAVLGKDEDFKNYIGQNTKIEVTMLGDPEMVNLKKSDIIQLQRKGFFICDRPYEKMSIHTGLETPIVLFSIPDGHTKVMLTTIPQAVAKATNKPDNATPKSEASSIDDISAQIVVQGNKIRDLKAEKATKNVIEEQVKVLLTLKANYKNLAGKDWTNPPPPKTDLSKPGDPTSLSAKLAVQADKVRELKSSKASKNVIDEEVKKLLSFKAEYKLMTGSDWKAGDTSKAGEKKSAEAESSDDIYILSSAIATQGNKVRDLKSSKAPKNIVAEEVNRLLALKAQFKIKSGRDWTAGDTTPVVANLIQSAQDLAKKTDKGNDELELAVITQKLTDQGNKVRELKSLKAPKDIIAAEVNILLALKGEFKDKAGRDWTPNDAVIQRSTAPLQKPESQSFEGRGDGNNKETETLSANIIKQGEKVRQLKNEKAAKHQIEDEVKALILLKDDFKRLTGNEWVSPSQPRSNESKKIPEKKNADKQASKKEKEGKKQKPEKPQEQKGDGGPKKVTRLGLEASKATNLPEWYSQVITKGELIEYYDVSGCYILRPWSYGIWEIIKDWLDKQFKSTGVKNCYFPMFVSKAVLEKEKSHIADFSPEVAWVTKSGDSDMAEPIAIRPTSETVMYPSFAKWVQSHRDLPIKLNQWNNVVRWEFKHPQPFLRTREFLWQEGHTAFASQKEAEEEVEIMLGFYEKVYTDLLAIPVVPGRKTEKEKFAGGVYTTTVEAFISASGRAIQGATSHHLGQNFSKMFDIVYDDPVTHEKSYAYQNSWGLTTRTIGVMIMIHADDQGLVLPPKVAPVQVIIVPCGITVSLPESEKNKLLGMCQNLTVMLTEAGLRVEADLRDNYSPGWKFNHWELKGVPLRVEIGPKDMAAQEVVVVERNTGEKSTVPMKGLATNLASRMDQVQASMLAKATAELHEHMIVCTEWEDFRNKVEEKKIIQVPFCGRIDCEDRIKEESARANVEQDVQAPSMGAKSLCIPFKPLRALLPEDKCIHPSCTAKPEFICLFGRSY
ncbi:unnamed protein product [Nesidiocoris tenuis]|uniref:Uncharacterized protein n=1 Tax=Nesidiocoris tenuis TaxID=355587 RepID=A0A6H5G1D5_9HEMI|nr:unnamed protein product [Nesidiocoris tenuis]